MPRGKQRGGGRGAPRGGRGGRGSARGRGGHANNPPPTWQQGGFTLMEAARETSRHDHKSWGLNSLRSQPVAFVSAGNSEPLKSLEDLLHHDEPKAADDTTAAVDFPASNQETIGVAGDDMKTNDGDKLYNMEKIMHEDQPATHDPEPFFFDVTKRAHMSPFPAPQSTAFPAPVPQAEDEDRPPSRMSSSSDEVILFRGRDSRPESRPESRPKTEDSKQISMAHMREEIRVVESQMEMEVIEALSIAEPRKSKKKGYHRDSQRPPKRSSSHDDAMIADYIENMRENGEEDMLLQMMRNQQDIGGSDYIPTSDESEAESEKVEEGTSEKPVSSSRDRDKTGGQQAGSHSKDNYVSESELDDETLAQLLAGHQLGQNPNPFADMASSEDTDSSDDDPQRWVDDLDVMDWDRPSLQKKKGKANKGRIRVEVSDSDLERTLQAAWKNDRFKKAERKRQREEMRALGQLGRNANPDDLRVKYPAGMSLEEVAGEMRLFLQGTSETLALPPMDKYARKMIHDLANKFNIKSKSVGNSDNRRPTLYRTKRTQQYSAASFDQAINKINRRYFPRLDARRGKGAPRSVGFGGRVNMAAATVQDGEIVGATAPELGIENRGRAMLEKMGWNKGDALGAMDNKGILQPVSHAMKRSKAGLG